MKVILVMVSTVNGKITRGLDPLVTHWTSEEDQHAFSDLKKQHNLIVMGRHTYEAGSKRIQLSKNILRIVLTKKPERFIKKTVPGQLEFSDEKPKQLLDRLQSAGFKTMLLVGGAEVNSSFFQAQLVNELHVTIEPKLFGSGKNLLGDVPLEINLELTKIQKLNERGTLLLMYSVI